MEDSAKPGKQNPDMPLVCCLPVTCSPPSLTDNTGDVDRLKRGLVTHPDLQGLHLSVPFSCLSTVARDFRQSSYSGQAVVTMLPERAELIDFLPALPHVLPAVALDLGTTHLEASLIDLQSSRTLARGHEINGQTRFGADILSRIHYAGRGRDGLQRLQEAVLASINQLLERLAKKSGCPSESFRALSVSGNTTMIHLLLGLDPAMICREPYIPLINAPEPCHSVDLGLSLHPLAPVWFFPSVGSYFGGDLISGILASGLDQSGKVRMLIDVGTNAEVVLGCRDWLIACAGAAGPALEGGVARMGMRAAPGAIATISIDPSTYAVSWQTIDDLPPVGICGSGMIDLVAALYLSRVIDLRGKFRRVEEAETAGLAAFLRERLVMHNGEVCFVVVPADQAGMQRPVLLGQIDLDAMMRSKAAMYAILGTLINQVGMRFSDLERINVAGAFGKHIDPRKAITLGMLPDLPLETFTAIGNSSLQGAELVLKSGQARRRSQEISARITYIELNVNQEFMIRFSGSRFIPHTDPSLFPSVPSFA